MRSIRNRSGSGTNEDNVDRLEQENDRAWRILVAKKDAEIIRDRGKPFYKRKNFGTAVGAFVGCFLSGGNPTMLLPMTALGAMAGRIIASKL